MILVLNEHIYEGVSVARSPAKVVYAKLLARYPFIRLRSRP